MKCTVLMGSPRKEGNTAAVLGVLLEDFRRLGMDCWVVDLYEKRITPCLGCKGCQDAENLGCVMKEDGLQDIYDSIQSSELLLLASPIYCWFCTAPMKAVMDRLVYATNKFYGTSGKKLSLLRGKAVAAVATCGYPPEKGSDLWDEALRRWCKHGAMEYRGMLSLRDLGGTAPFLTEDSIVTTREFAREQYRRVLESRGEHDETN